jgi:hypothetical protein
MKLWDTPFSKSSFPAAQVIPSDEDASTVDVLVRPSGLDTFPAYLVKFAFVPMYRSHYEGMMPFR